TREEIGVRHAAPGPPPRHSPRLIGPIIKYLFGAPEVHAKVAAVWNRTCSDESMAAPISSGNFPPRRVLIAKVGLDGHDVGARVVARGLLDAGMEVIYTGIRRTPADVARAALEEDVAVVGISILSGAHLTLLPAIRRLLDEAGAPEIRLIAGGVIPQEDIPELMAKGVDRVFLSGTSVDEIVEYVRAIGSASCMGRGTDEPG